LLILKLYKLQEGEWKTLHNEFCKRTNATSDYRQYIMLQIPT